MWGKRYQSSLISPYEAHDPITHHGWDPSHKYNFSINLNSNPATIPLYEVNATSKFQKNSLPPFTSMASPIRFPSNRIWLTELHRLYIQILPQSATSSATAPIVTAHHYHLQDKLILHAMFSSVTIVVTPFASQSKALHEPWNILQVRPGPAFFSSRTNMLSSSMALIWVLFFYEMWKFRPMDLPSLTDWSLMVI